MELKEYQSNALGAFTRWLNALVEAKMESDRSLKALDVAGISESEDSDLLDVVYNYPQKAWKNLAASGDVAYPDVEHNVRRDGLRRSIPHVCMKIPTGGGKTLLAASCLERIHQQTGLVLWLTPTKAIYNQTKKALWNKEHPYRQTLERASGGRVKMLEKESNFSNYDIANYLCVMLVSYPATNRNRGKEFLRIFRDSGRYLSFFPEVDDVIGERDLLEKHPDLELLDGENMAKRSLFNVVKILRPVVILDEAHKAYGISRVGANEEFVKSVNRLNPRMVIEFSATPHPDISNLLVDIDGPTLKQEEMVKLPVQVYSTENVEWQVTLRKAYDKLEDLNQEALSLQENINSYIRPIAIVRTERTGKDQRDGKRVHAEDVREYLIQTLGAAEESVRIQSSHLKELKDEDLLSEFSPVRWIITKAALMEGWDCSFAYLLVMLDNSRSKSAITQLIGRVMRQPYARLTNRQALDQCYVYCWNIDVSSAVQHVKEGLEGIGLSGLGDSVHSSIKVPRTVNRREAFRDLEIFLPKVLHLDEGNWVELNYRRHILPEIDWDLIVTRGSQGKMLLEPQIYHATVDVEGVPNYSREKVKVNKSLQISWFTRRLSDIMPNPWRASQIVTEMIEKQISAGQTRDDIYDRRSEIADALFAQVEKVVQSSAQQVFLSKLREGIVRFDLDTRIPSHRLRKDTYEILVDSTDHSFERRPGDPIQISLFEPVFDSQFDSNLERNFARYLDEERALQWWHRVAVRQSGDYYLRGWTEDRIWPDFIAMATDKGSDHLLIIETKGEHFRDNADAAYKEKVLQALEGAFNAGQMTVRNGPAQGTFRLVFDRTDYPAFDYQDGEFQQGG